VRATAHCGFRSHFADLVGGAHPTADGKAGPLLLAREKWSLAGGIMAASARTFHTSWLAKLAFISLAA